MKETLYLAYSLRKKTKPKKVALFTSVILLSVDMKHPDFLLEYIN